MENEFSIASLEPYAMKGGDGPHSYAQNSTVQRLVIEAAKNLVQDAISKHFDPKAICGSSICIADLGCSTGPNTFIAMQYIIEALQLQYHSHNLPTPEFQVFFNDQVSNDFNTLFHKLPPNRNYFAAGVPGSFHGRLFPRQSLHLVHSSASLHWMSKLPKEINDRNCGAWNKGRIHYTSGAPKEVVDAYEKHYKMELDSFLNARAEEIVGKGLMAIQIVAAQDVIDDKEELYPGKDLEILGSCLMDMAKLGLVSEEKIDTFNVPIYFPKLKDVKKILESNEDFMMEQIEPLAIATAKTKTSFALDLEMYVSHFRAAFEGLIEKHFGEALVDEVFDRYTKKVMQFPDIKDFEMRKLVGYFALLKRKAVVDP